MSKKIIYDYIITDDVSLAEEIRALNMCQDKIVAVTQHGTCYTIFYERNGNDEEKNEID